MKHFPCMQVKNKPSLEPEYWFLSRVSCFQFTYTGEMSRLAVRRNRWHSTNWWTLGVMVVTPVTNVPTTLCLVWTVITANRVLLGMNNQQDHSVVLLVVLHILRRLQVRSVDSPHGPWNLPGTLNPPNPSPGPWDSFASPWTFPLLPLDSRISVLPLYS